MIFRKPKSRVILDILDKHKAVGFFRRLCRSCGQSWPCHSRMWADDAVRQWRRAERKRRADGVVSPPSGSTGGGAAGGMAQDGFRWVGRRGGTAGPSFATQEMPAVRLQSRIQSESVGPKHRANAEPRAMHVFGRNHAGNANGKTIRKANGS